jgi:hypothetical protein
VTPIAGGVLAAAILAATVLAVPGPARLGRALYDGVSPLPPYQWAHPPRELARDNRPPQAGHATRDLDPAGRSAGAVATGDAQCTVIFNEGSIAAGPLGGTISVTVTPLDPAVLGPPPPGTRFDGNGCRFEATYGGSTVSPQYRRPVTVVLRYATDANQIVRAAPAEGQPWQPVRTVRYAGHLHLLVADVAALGTFAPVAAASTPYLPRTTWAPYVVAVFVAFALLLGWAPRLLKRRRESSR